MDQEVSMKTMILAFRVTELQTLLSYAGKNRSGRKNELQARAMELMKSNKGTINAKIRELYQSIQLSNLAQQPPASAGIINQGGGHGQVLTASSASNLLQHQRSNFNLNRMYATGGYAGAADKVLLGKNPYNNTGYTNMGINRIATSLHSINTPICPDVQLTKLPFYDILSVLIKPTSLISHTAHRGIQDMLFPFCFKPSEATEISASKEYNYTAGATAMGESKMQYTTQVQLRFCVADTAGTQTDAFPTSLVVKVNGKMITLPPPIPSNRPGVEPKRPSRPLNITNCCKLSPTVGNNIQVAWSPDPSGKTYCISVYLVKKLCSKDLLGRLKAKGSRPSDFTRGMIKEICQKDDVDCCVATTTLKVSLACPLGKSRMAIPCRASTCSHLQCFDANLFIQMNEKKPTWVCPVCDKPTLFDNLAIDGYFEEVISKVTIDEGNDIEIAPDADWSVSVKSDEPPAKKSRTAPAPTKLANKTINLDDDIVIEDEDDSSPAVTEQVSASSEKQKDKLEKPTVDFVDLTLSSTEDEEEAPSPPPVRVKSPVKKPDPEPAPQKVVDDVPPQKEREKSPVKSSRSKEEGEVNGSSDEEEQIRPVRRQPSRQARPTFLHDESSSSSHGSDSSASTRAPDSPQCITLESDSSSSRSPTPPRHRETSKLKKQAQQAPTGSAGGGSNIHSTAANSFLSSGSVFVGGSSSSSSQQSASQPAAATNPNNYSTSLSYPNALPNPRYNDGNYSASAGFQSGAAYRAANASGTPPILRQSQVDPYSSGSYGMPGYDAHSGWETSAFNSVADFGSLEYPSMDYFNQTPSYGAANTGTYGGRPGGGYSQWR